MQRRILRYSYQRFRSIEETWNRPTISAFSLRSKSDLAYLHIQIPNVLPSVILMPRPKTLSGNSSGNSGGLGEASTVVAERLADWQHNLSDQVSLNQKIVNCHSLKHCICLCHTERFTARIKIASRSSHARASSSRIFKRYASLCFRSAKFSFIIQR